MRCTFLAFSLVGMLSLAVALCQPAGQSATGPTDRCVACPANPAAPLGEPRVCRQQDHPTAAILHGVEDQRIRARIIQAGRQLLQDASGPGHALLQKELAREKCQLQLPAPGTLPADPAALYDRCRPGVVAIAGVYLCPNCHRHHASTASGFVLTADGAIATNYHVVESDREQILLVYTDEGQIYPVESVMAADRRVDVAIIRIDADDLHPLPLAASRQQAAIGQTVYVISHPVEHFYSLTSGIISRYVTARRRGGSVDTMDITADYARGSSGGPVLNDRGEVVGLVMRTESIYYSVEDGVQKNLQMVFKTCIPVSNLKTLLAP